MSSFDDIYANVPTEQRERLRQFRATHQSNIIAVNDVTWEYLMGGEGSTTVLLLVGGLRVADASFRSFGELEKTYRVIAPTYPAVSTMRELADGLAGTLAAEGVDAAVVLAGSFGGMVAQCFARTYPDCIQKLILSTTTVLDESAAERYAGEKALLEPLPAEMLLQGAKERFYQMVAPPESESIFWRAYLEELFGGRLSKADLLSTYDCLLDFAANYRFAPEDFPEQQHILILESDNDATFSETQRAAIKRLYTGARVHTFSGAGHSPATTQRETYFQVVRAFIDED